MIEKIDFNTGMPIPLEEIVLWAESWQTVARQINKTVAPFFSGYLPPLFHLKTRYPKEFCKPIPTVKLCP